MRKAVEKLFEYPERVADARWKEAWEGLISATANAEEDGQRLSRDDLLTDLVPMAGNETMRNLIGNGTLALLRNLSELERLRDDLSLLDLAVDEFLRYESLVQLDSQFVTKEVEIGGKLISPGQLVVYVLGVASRDLPVFPTPTRWISGGRPQPHGLWAADSLLPGAPLAIAVGAHRLQCPVAPVQVSAADRGTPLPEPGHAGGLEALWPELKQAD